MEAAHFSETLVPDKQSSIDNLTLVICIVGSKCATINQGYF
jgi:hypothetical protein